MTRRIPLSSVLNVGGGAKDQVTIWADGYRAS
jgi:hypothetical protein